MSWFSSMMNGGNYSNPADAAMPYLEEVPGWVDEYYNPYIETGLEAGGIAQDQYAAMASDPAAYYNDIYSNYDQSDYYKYQSDLMGETAANTSAAGGYSGTDTDVMKQTELQNALLSKDFQQYLTNYMAIQGQGLQGEQQMYTTGYGASNQAANAMIQNSNAKAGLSYAGTASQNQYNAATTNALMEAMGMTAGSAAYYGLKK